MASVVVRTACLESDVAELCLHRSWRDCSHPAIHDTRLEDRQICCVPEFMLGCWNIVVLKSASVDQAA